MIFNFEFYLTLAVVLSGLVWLIDVLFFAPARNQPGSERKEPILIEYARSFFPVLLIVLLLRSFFVEPFRIPSGSDEPTLLVGDFILVNKYVYGLRLPVFHNKIFAMNEPKTGDIIIFRWPVDLSMILIKRVIGVPGDKISYVNKELFINGRPAPQELLGDSQDVADPAHPLTVFVREENLAGVVHKIYLRPDVPPQDFSVVVPPGNYFVMGDNRDGSNDSRYWGFVPEANVAGKAIRIWMSWNNNLHNIRWDRIGTKIQ